VLGGTIDSAIVAAWYFGDKTKALASIQAGLQRTPLTNFAPLDRPYEMLAQAYALAGRPDLARTVMADFDKVSSSYSEEDAVRTRHGILSLIAMAEKRYLDAAHESEAADVGACTLCALPVTAIAYDLAQRPDSAISFFARYVNSTSVRGRVPLDRFFLAGSYKRLGELLEAKGDRAGAARNYAKFVDLWKNADPVLQPQVAEVRKRLTRLSDVEAR
jgi:hypothetical protein